MYLRKNANQKVEVSFDEPLNTDWDGNELLLSDILGTDGDTVLRPIEDDVDRQLLTTAVSRLSEREREIITLRSSICSSLPLLSSSSRSPLRSGSNVSREGSSRS